MELVRRTIERYVPLNEQEWRMIGPCWLERSFAKGTMISRPGAVEQWFYIVKDGV